MEEYLNLPQGSVLNLQPRPRHGRPAKNHLSEASRNSPPRQQPEAASSDEENRVTFDDPDKGDSTPTATTPTLHRTKATKLPMSKALTEKAKDRQNTKTVETGDQEKKNSSPAPLKGSSSPGESRPSESTPPTDKDREQNWQKVKEMFDKANNHINAYGSPKSSSKDKQKGHYQEAYRKFLSLANSSKHEINRQKLKYAGGSTPTLKSPPRSGVPKPKTLSPKAASQQDPVSATRKVPAALTAGRAKPQPTRDGQLKVDTQESAPPKYSDRTDTTDSSIHSYPSISPVSGPSTSITEWEDRFVVNMPSAREPNPPTMNSHQISEFQKSIEMVHKEGGAMLDPDTLPSPRTRTPEDHDDSPDRNEKNAESQDSQDPPTSSGGFSDFLFDTTDRRYYSPEEIGKQRCSTIWEESPGRPKRLNSDINPDGSFLGCKEINGPQDKNPDEILLFSSFTSPAERPRLVDVAPAVKASKEWKKPTTTTTSEAKAPAEPPKPINTLQDEWRPISQNLKNALCSRPSPRTLCQETKCQETTTTTTTTTKCQETKCQPPPPEKPVVPPTTTTTPTAKPPEKENSGAGGGLIRRRPVQKAKRGDDVFIITPTITRTLVNENKNGTTSSSRRKTSATPEITTTNKPAINRGEATITTTTGTDARAKTPIASTPSGLRRATQHSWTRSNNSLRPLPTPPTTEPLVGKPDPDKSNGLEKSRAIRGFIRMPGMVKSSTENFGARPRNNSEHNIPPPPPIPIDDYKTRPTRSVSDVPRCVSPVKQAATATERPEYASSIRSARIFEVAELDGLQLGEPKEIRKEKGPSSDAFEGRRSISPARKGGALTRRTHIRLRSNTTNVLTEPRQVLNPLTWGLIMDILALSAAQAQSIYSQIVTNRESRMDLAKSGLNCILGMVGHCLHVFRDVLTALSVYNTTGAWPKNEERDLLRFLSDFGQAVVYFVALGFMMMVVGRAAGYVVLIGSWIVWFTRPFGWVLGSLARVVLT